MLYIFSGHVTATEYYVSAAPQGIPCPTTDFPCHKLSYYVADYSSYFTDDTIFYFLEGTHTLQGILEITNISNITLQGQGHIEQGFHETVMQSTSVISCSDNKRVGIQITTSNGIVMKSLAIANCAFDAYISSQKIVNSLHFVNINDVTLEWVSVQNSSGYGLCLLNNFNVLIANSSFANNGHPKTFGGNTYIYYNDQPKNVSKVNIVQSNFTMSLGYAIFLKSDSEVEVIIENSEFSHNIEGGIYIDSYGNGSIGFHNCTINNNTVRDAGGVSIILQVNASIEFHNCAIYNNTCQYVGGGGVSINLQTNGSIEFHNCTIYNNTAQYAGGGGVLIDSYGNGSIEFHNCMIYNNTAQYDGGGGVSINLHVNGSIEFHICTIYNNTAYNPGGGGGVLIDSNGNGNIELHNCTIYNNTAHNPGGGGVYIDSHGNSSIDFHICTIYNNNAKHYNGGRMLLNSSIDFHNCTINYNTARYGGGMHVTSDNGRIEFHNCTIYVNTAQNDFGGGVYIDLHGKGSIDFYQCTLYNNIAQENQGGGGGVYIYSKNGSIEFNNCIIYNNTVQDAGGGVLIESLGNGSIVFYNCTVYANTAQKKEGGICIYSLGIGSIRFSNCTIYNNTVQQAGGGGVYINSEDGSIDFNNCTIYNNTVQYTGSGGGVLINSFGNGNIKFVHCIVYINTAKKNGVGVYIYSNGGGSINFSNCTIYNNKGQHAGGGGIYIYSKDGCIEFSNCTLYNNTVRYYGGGMLIESFENSIVEFLTCTVYINTAQKYGGGVYIYSDGSGSIKFSNCIIYNNTAYVGSGLYLNVHRITSTTSFRFTNVSFHFNKVPNRNDVYQAAVVLINIHDITLDQIEVSNHNTTGLVSFNSVITFEKNNKFVNNSGIYGGGIALYESSQLLLRNQTYVFFVNNHASESGGGIFVSQLLVDDIYTNCSFPVISHNSLAWLYFVKNTANISGDVLYGGKIDNCSFDDLFHYHQQKGQSVVSSDAIQVCFVYQTNQIAQFLI